MALTGTVTSTFSSYGIIDEDIYFDYKVVVGEIPYLGTVVNYIEELRGESQHAVSVSVVEDTSLERTSVCGPLTRIDKDIGYVEDIPFKLSLCDPPPSRGDMLSVELSQYNGVMLGSAVSYVRKRRFTCYVLRVTPRECTLEDLTYFTRAVCPNAYNPQPRDTVCGMAVECTYKEYWWRAIELKPTSSTVYSAPLQLYRLPKFCLNKAYRECGLGQDGDLVVCKPNSMKIGHLNPGDTTDITFTLLNTSPKIVLILEQVTISDTSILHLHAPIPHYIHPHQEETIDMAFTNADLGQHVTTLRFGIRVNEHKILNISRRLHINTITPRTGDCLRARVDQPFLKDCQVIPGVRPERSNPRFYPNHFPVYDMPSNITSDSDNERLMADLSINNYKYIMHTLLFMEEKYMEEEMQQYSIHETSLMRRGGYLSISVPAMVESKLSLIIGDRVVLEQIGSRVKYEGYIHKVDEQREEIMVKFEEVFQSNYNSQHVNIHFTHNRTSFRRCHTAVDYILKQGEGILFPTSVTVKSPHFNVTRLNLYNKDLNREQVAAVKHIIEAKARPLPYLLYGPPGTGKTVTIVEAILQIYNMQSDSRILVCAPSNSACDLVAQRLLDSGQDLDLVRLNSITRYTENLPDNIKRASFSCDEIKEASLKRIIIATCISAGNLYKLALRVAHFTHVFVDEAGQAIEAEVMLPISLSTGPGTQAVLAGDPYQLGPVVKNPSCEGLGMQVSLLERLMDLKIYERNELFPENNCYDPIMLTKLVKNYRTHANLLILPSRLFYENELVPCAPSSLVDRVVGDGDLLRNPDIPFLFHGVRGEEMREQNNPSIFNPIEIMQVISYIKLLTTSRFTSSEIGVITPYRKQAEKTRMMLQSTPGLQKEKIKVASVEDFQGQERPVIIISTVRSNNALPGDKTRLLGFLQNPKRFNVAVTRAQALLIVVGNPDVLKHDEYWGALLNFAVDNNCYVGCVFDS